MPPYTVLCAPGDGTREFTGTLPSELHFQPHSPGCFSWSTLSYPPSPIQRPALTPPYSPEAISLATSSKFFMAHASSCWILFQNLYTESTDIAFSLVTL